MSKKRVLKRILKHRLVTACAVRVLVFYLRLAYITTRWTYAGEHKAFYDIAKKNKPIVALFWHGKLAIPGFFRPKHMTAYALISKHRDGAFLADIMHKLGLKTVSGSTSRGGTSALLQSIRVLEEGALLAVTPDGPRGPREKISGHAIYAAARSGAYICPLTYDCALKKTFNSWDRFTLPLPFGRGVIYFAEPFLCVQGDEDAAQRRAQLALDNAEHSARRLITRSR